MRTAAVCASLIVLSAYAAASVVRGATSALATGAIASEGGVPQDGDRPAVSSAVTGRVTDAETGRPLSRVNISLDGSTASAVTDIQGRFEVKSLSPGQYRVRASKTGYSPTFYGQERMSDRPVMVTIGASSVANDIDMRLSRAAVITARIVDEFGDPVSGYIVQALEARYQGGQRQLTAVAGSIAETTDDRGEQRLHGLKEGKYYVAVRKGLTPITVSPMSEAPIYYPGTLASDQAEPIPVAPGGDVSVTVTVFRATRSRLEGTVTDSTGSPPASASISLRVRQLGSVAAIPGTVLRDGRFIIENVPPGRYTIQASTETEYAAVPIQVSGQDIVGIPVPTRLPGHIRGRFLFDTGVPPPGLRPQAIDIQTVASDAGMSLSRGRILINDDWTFALAGVMAWGRIGVRPPPPWYLKSIMVEGVDVTDLPLDIGTAFNGKHVEVILTQRTTEVSGLVFDTAGRTVAQAVVVIYADDREKWFPGSRAVVSLRTDDEGRFSARDLPTGRYRAAAVNGLAGGEERSMDVLERLRSTGVSVSLADGESKTVTLRVSTIR